MALTIFISDVVGKRLMDVEKLAPFSNQKYLNLVTYRKSGTAVSTPLWFVEDRGVLYVRTPAKAGKVKRLRSNPQVRVVPSDRHGNQKGVWIDGQARLVDGTRSEERRVGKEWR